MTLHAIWIAVIAVVISIGVAFKVKAIQAGVEWCWKRLWNQSEVTVEIREVCEDKILASLQVDGYTVDTYVFLRVWVVNKKEVPTVPKDWTLTVASGKRKLKAEQVPNISKWHQHSKVEKKQQGFTFVEDIRKELDAFGNQPLQRGIPVEGWLCFLVRGTHDGLLKGATIRLALMDSLGRNHRTEGIESWGCKGNMVNPEKLW